MPKRGQILGENIPAKPFADWLNARVKFHEARINAAMPLTLGFPPRGPLSPTAQTARELGWEGEAGLKKLWRHRNMMRDRSINRKSVLVPTEWVRRDVVEEALHRAGVGLWEVYAELVEDIVLEPERWCDVCEEVTTPVDGVCPWCENVPDRRMAA